MAAIRHDRLEERFRFRLQTRDNFLRVYGSIAEMSPELFLFLWNEEVSHLQPGTPLDSDSVARRQVQEQTLAEIKYFREVEANPNAKPGAELFEEIEMAKALYDFYGEAASLLTDEGKDSFFAGIWDDEENTFVNISTAASVFCSLYCSHAQEFYA